MNKITLSVAALLVALAIVGGYLYPKNQTTTIVKQYGSAAGTSYQTPTFVGTVMTMANGTSTSILNPYGQTVYVDFVKVACTGIGSSFTSYTGTGLASLKISIATTSTATPAPAFAYNFALLLNSVISTSTATTLIASSSVVSATSSYSMVWNAGEYETFATNATNTAVCTVGVGVIGS